MVLPDIFTSEFAPFFIKQGIDLIRNYISKAEIRYLVGKTEQMLRIIEKFYGLSEWVQKQKRKERKKGPRQEKKLRKMVLQNEERKRQSKDHSWIQSWNHSSHDQTVRFWSLDSSGDRRYSLRGIVIMMVWMVWEEINEQKPSVKSKRWTPFIKIVFLQKLPLSTVRI